MHLTITPPEVIPSDSQALVDGIAADLGLVPNMARVIATSATLLAAFDGIRRAVAQPRFDPVHREIAGIAVGIAIDNRYGVAFHSTMLSRLGIADDEIEAMRAGTEPADPLPGAVYAFARSVAVDRGAVPAGTIQRALDAGLDPPQLLQLVAESVLATLVGIVDNLAGRVELDEFLERWAWPAAGVRPDA